MVLVLTRLRGKTRVRFYSGSPFAADGWLLYLRHRFCEKTRALGVLYHRFAHVGWLGFYFNTAAGLPGIFVTRLLRICCNSCIVISSPPVLF